MYLTAYSGFLGRNPRRFFCVAFVLVLRLGPRLLTVLASALPFDQF